MTSERIGIARSDPALPALDQQVELLTAVGRCASVMEVDAGTVAAKRLDKFLRTTAGATLCVVGLEVFDKPLADLVRLLRDLAELGVSIAIVAATEDEVVLGPDETAIALLTQLSACNGRAQPVAETKTWYGRPFRTAAQFTRPQVLHARKLYEEGMSLRAIGLIFETSPEEVWKVVA